MDYSEKHGHVMRRSFVVVFVVVCSEKFGVTNASVGVLREY